MTSLRTFTAPALGALAPLILAGSIMVAPSPSRASYELGLHAGPFLPSRIGGVREIMQGWGGTVSARTDKGVFELDTFFARAEGTSYNSFLLNYRVDLANDMLPVHFLIGAHLDYFTPPDEYELGTKKTGGWHFGAGMSQPLAGPVNFRADFKYRFGPGNSLMVNLGLSFAWPDGQGAN